VLAKSLIGIITTLLTTSSVLMAQSSDSTLSELEKQEIALLNIIDRISNSTNNLDRNEWNSKLIKDFEIVLSDPKALSYPFDKLYAISDLTSPSGNLRIFTWELPNDQNVNTYYGILCYIYDNEVYTEILKDSSERLSNPEFKSLTSQKWYGALYYDLREYTYKKNRFVVLLGINRSDELIKKRIIEILEVGEKARFGKEIFVFPKKIIGLKRKIYQYSIDADMSIWFEEETDIILFDHLSPLKAMYEGKYEFYAPDLSFDALEYKKGKLYYEADYDARMKKTKNDPFFEMEIQKEEKIY